MYVVNFTKESNHDYEGFFNQPIESKEISALRKEIQRLQSQLEESMSNMEMLKNSTGSDMYEPTKTKMVLEYQGRNQYIDFDLNTGLIYTGDRDDCRIVSVNRKQGEFYLFVGYSYPLASAIVKRIKYSISSDNSKATINTKEEALIPLLDKIALCYTKENNSISSSYCTSSFLSALERINATEFIQNFYGIDIEVPFSLEAMKEYAQRNAGFEVILRTARPKDFITLLSISCEKSMPIHKMLQVTKEEYEIIIEKDCLKEFVWITKYFKDKPCFPNNKSIIEYLSNCKKWEEDLGFYDIYHTNLHETLLKIYFGDGWWGWDKFPEYYSLGKFCNYVVTETINQGFTSIDNFTSTLRDYIRMCVDIGFTPHFYTTSLSLTHNVASRNHKIVVTEEQEDIFKSRYDGFEPFEFREYILIAPKCSEDIKNEGSALNHCVASYIKNIIDGTTAIYFLRLKKKFSESLVTVEVKNNAIVQARGVHNRDLSVNEEQALRTFCADRKLAYKVV